MANESLDAFIGAKFRVTTSLGETFEANLFTYDKASDCAVFQDASHFPKRTIRIVQGDSITDLVALSPASVVETRHFEVRPAPTQLIRHKEEEAVEHQAILASRIGDGVSGLAQAVFDAISKTYQCAWDGESIIVQGVRIVPPYAEENCSGGDTEVVLARIKKVLANERRKIAAKV